MESCASIGHATSPPSVMKTRAELREIPVVLRQVGILVFGCIGPGRTEVRDHPTGIPDIRGVGGDADGLRKRSREWVEIPTGRLPVRRVFMSEFHQEAIVGVVECGCRLESEMVSPGPPGRLFAGEFDDLPLPDFVPHVFHRFGRQRFG